MHTPISSIVSDSAPRTVTFSGFVDVIRDHKKHLFFVIRDRTDMVQVFADKALFPDTHITTESFVRISGHIESRPEVRLHGFEIVATQIEILSVPEEDLPISWKSEWYPSLSERLDHRHLSLREPRILLAFEMMSYFDLVVREFCYEQGCIEIHTPKIIPAASEGGAELFRLDYFGRDAYLAQSPQLYKQMAIASGFGKVLEIAPAFRADPSFTSRHVTEITMLDIEISPIESPEDVISFAEHMLQTAFSKIHTRFASKVAELYDREITIPSLPFPRTTFTQAREILEKEFGIAIAEDEDMSAEWERRLSEWVYAQYGHDFLFVTGYPSSVRAFYTMNEASTPTISKGFDLLYRGLEVSSGAQREHRYDQLVSQIRAGGMDPAEFEHYLACFRHGMPPHGGFGFGIARLFKQLLWFETVKEVILAPRDPKRLAP